MTPIYGFLQGDVIGLLVLAYDDDTVAMLGEKLKKAASVRVAPKSGGRVKFQGRFLEPELKFSKTEISALDRIDVVWEDA